MRKSGRPKVTATAQAVRFLRVSHLLLWTIWVIYRERCRVIRAHTSGNHTVRPDSEALIRALTRFRDRARNLGILIIKFGQFLSVRVDLLPERAIAILSSLQDDVPPAPFEHIAYVIETELGKPLEEVFSVLEHQCVAAASLGQVHKAVLASTGDVVALKVQRPNVEQLIRIDLRALKCVIWLLTRFVRLNGFIDLTDIFHEFEYTTYQEIDYVREAANAKRFKEMFKDDPRIYVPRVYDQYVSRRLLVLEWIDGIKINNYEALDASGISRLEVVKRTVSSYFYQLFDAGFFHADPHPGNIFVKKGSTSADPIITFIDFGMMGSHTTAIKRCLKEAFLAVIARDARSLVTILTKLGFIGEGANVASIERSLSLLMERYCGSTLGEISKADIAEMAQDAIHLFYGQPFQIPAQFAFTGRAMSTLFGFSTVLAPEFNFIEVALPYTRRFLGLDAEGLEQTLFQLIGQVIETGKVLLTLPCTLEQVLSDFERGGIEIGVASNGRTRLHRSGKERDVSRGSSANDRFAWSVMFVTSLGGGIFLLAGAHQLLAGWFCFGLTSLTLLRALLKG